MPTPKVEIYTKSDCTDCQAAKTFLKAKGISFTEKNVTTDPAAKSELQQKHQSQSTPTVVIDGMSVVGFGDQQKKQIEQLLGKKTTTQQPYSQRQQPASGK